MLSIDNVVVDRRRASIVAGRIATRLTGHAASQLVPLLRSPPDYVCTTCDTHIALQSPNFCIKAWIDQCLFRTRFWSFWSMPPWLVIWGVITSIPLYHNNCIKQVRSSTQQHLMTI